MVRKNPAMPAMSFQAGSPMTRIVASATSMVTTVAWIQMRMPSRSQMAFSSTRCRVAELSFIGRSRLPGVRPESGGVALVVFVVELVDLSEHAVESTDDILLKIEQRRRRV